MNKALIGTGAALAVLLTSIPALAQNAERQLRRDVRQSCMELAWEAFENPRMLIDAIGSETYATAIVRGIGLETKERERAICVYNKTTRTAELGAFLRKPKKKNQQGAVPPAKQGAMTPGQPGAMDDGAMDDDMGDTGDSQN